MFFEENLSGKRALILTLDNTLFPEKDYLLQVYYLFSEFMAYSEQVDAKAIVDFMSTTYTAEGEDGLFDKTAQKFDLPLKYKENFLLLHETARLPLKLLLFKDVLTLLQSVVANGMQIFVIAIGNPAVAINKIKQIEWNGLQEHLKIYFTVEYEGSIVATVSDILNQQALKEKDAAFLGAGNLHQEINRNLNIDSFPITKIM